MERVRRRVYLDHGATRVGLFDCFGICYNHEASGLLRGRRQRGSS